MAKASGCPPVIRIVNVRTAEVHRLEVPLDDTYRSAHHPELRVVRSLLVVLEADDARGIGTADAVPGYSRGSSEATEETLATDLLPEVLANGFDNPNQLKRFLEGIDGAANAKCALESAFIDLYARTHGETVVEYLGGRLDETVALNAWVGFDEPEVMAEKARAWVDRGFESMKIKLDGDADTDLARVRAVFDAVGGEADIRADANEAYDLQTAIEVARALEEFPLVHFEQPIAGDDLAGLERLTNATTTPIMADECLVDLDRVRRVLERGAADRLKLKILRLGGVLNTRIALDYAQVHGVGCVVGHGFCLSPAASAELQLIASHPNVFGAAETVGPLKLADEPFEPTVDMAGGTATLPDGPGLGVELDDESLMTYRVGGRSVE